MKFSEIAWHRVGEVFTAKESGSNYKYDANRNKDAGSDDSRRIISEAGSGGCAPLCTSY